jgi:hypothetical protein
VERGVRFVQLYHTTGGFQPWDQHSDLKAGHEKNSAATDKPIAGLLQDLKARGLLDETLVIWGGEFGRTPTAQGSDGRDHHPYGFSMWLAGGGIRGGMTYGSTDEFGWDAVENRVHVHDLHATILHLLGLDHEKLTASRRPGLPADGCLRSRGPNIMTRPPARRLDWQAGKSRRSAASAFTSFVTTMSFHPSGSLNCHGIESRRLLRGIRLGHGEHERTGFETPFGARRIGTAHSSPSMRSY